MRLNTDSWKHTKNNYYETFYQLLENVITVILKSHYRVHKGGGRVDKKLPVSTVHQWADLIPPGLCRQDPGKVLWSEEDSA